MSPDVDARSTPKKRRVFTGFKDAVPDHRDWAGAAGMREAIGAKDDRLRAATSHLLLCVALFLAGASVCADAAMASAQATAFTVFDRFEQHEFAALALTIGVILFALLAAVALVRTRAHAVAERASYRRQIAAMTEAVDRAALLVSEPQALIIWSASGEPPEIIGDLSMVLPDWPSECLLAFGTWLQPDTAHTLENAVDGLRVRGSSFTMTVKTRFGRHIEIEGRAVAGRAVLRLREASGVKRELAETIAEHRKAQRRLDAIDALIEALPSPVWIRDEAGRLVFVNSAYARAVEVDNPADIVANATELFDRNACEELGDSDNGAYARRLGAIVAGRQRVLDVIVVPTARGSAGIGIDATEVETLRRDLARMVDAHRRTLDQLATAVAVFDAQRRLTFYNAAYRALWDLTASFLDQSPTDSAVLDFLRAARKLPEQQDFRHWRTQLHEAYQAVEATQQEWHLPDGRTLRVVTTPDLKGGVTYLFDDVTERLDLERRFDALIRVQGETLDNLAEAVAVFGSDGRLRLSNPAFASVWKLKSGQLAEHPHIEAVISWCRQFGSEHIWQNLRTAITALDVRMPTSSRMERTDGLIIDCATLPLPDGATLVTFTDVTASVNVERALIERNEALLAAEKLKEDFVHHMSYELRSPLTNIIGFTHFLGDPKTGPLNERQREYLGYISSSTDALLALVDSILDLATIEAGAMTLDLGPVDIRTALQAAAAGVQDRLIKDEITLAVHATPDIGAFMADERRIRQVLFNLLANAVGFSPRGGTVTLAAERRADAIVVSVADQGPGIPPNMTDKVFDWFESNPLGSRHRGVGLGLSLVRSFVELHGGTVQINSVIGRGTTVLCIFPLEQLAARTAAE